MIGPLVEATPRPARPDLLNAAGSSALASHILSDRVLERLAAALPRRFSPAEWRQLYSTQHHGASLGTLYRRCAGRGGALVVIRTTRGDVLGALLSEVRKPAAGQAATAAERGVKGRGAARRPA